MALPRGVSCPAQDCCNDLRYSRAAPPAHATRLRYAMRFFCRVVCAGRLCSRRGCCCAGRGARLAAAALATRLRAGLPAFFYAQGEWQSLA